jgi:hypothetical protein
MSPIGGTIPICNEYEHACASSFELDMMSLSTRDSGRVCYTEELRLVNNVDQAIANAERRLLTVFIVKGAICM